MELATSLDPAAGLQPARSPARQAGRTVGQAAFFATTLFAAQLYLQPAAWLPQTAPFHIALLLSLLALSSLGLQRFLTNRPLFLGVRSAFLLAYVAVAVTSVSYTIDRVASLAAAAEIVKHFLFFLVVTNTATTPGRIRTALLLFAAAAFVPGYGTWWNYSHGELLVEGFRGRFYGVMADPNHDAMALVAAIPLQLYLLVSGKGLWRKAIGLAGVAACLAGVIATHSRGGSIGLAVALVVAALMARRKLLAFAAVAVIGLSVLVLAPKTFWERDQTIAQYNQDASVQGRMHAWQVAGRIAHDHPLGGVGAGAFLAAWEQYAPMDAGPQRFVAHNLFLEVLGEEGAIGLFGMVGFLLCALWSCWRARNGEMGSEARAVLAALCGYLVCQQFSGYSLSWFLYALCGFAACCDLVGGREAKAAKLSASASEATPPAGQPIRSFAV